MAASVQPEKILKDLGNLWVDLGKQDENGVLRACAMTFVVTVAEAHDSFAVGETIAAIMHNHPSRAIVVRVRPGDEPFLDARVFAQCWMPFGGRQQICCEQIEISSSLGSLADVPAVIRGLIVPDLPVVLYCPDIGLSRSPQFQALLPLAGKLVIDSGPAAGLAPLAREDRYTADLAWSRVTGWREAIAQIFENPENLKAAYSLDAVEIRYTGKTEPATSLYLAAWFKHLLGTDATRTHVVGPAFASIASVGLRGPGFAAMVQMKNDCSVESTVNGVSQRVVFPELKEHDLLMEELSIVGRDPLFEDVLRIANAMRLPY